MENTIFFINMIFEDWNEFANIIKNQIEITMENPEYGFWASVMALLFDGGVFLTTLFAMIMADLGLVG